MRIRIIKKITPPHVDIQLDRFQPGLHYEVDRVLGALFVAEGWAEEASGLPSVTTSVIEQTYPAEWDSMTQTLHRDMHLPSLEEAFAADVAFDDALAAAIERKTLLRCKIETKPQ